MNKQLNVQRLPHMAYITVPQASIDKMGLPVYKDWLRRLAQVGGGYTIMKGMGGWVSPQGDLVEEAVQNVFVDYDADAEAIAEKTVTVTSILREMVDRLFLLGEKAVLTGDGNASFILSQT